jgi:hypothetical protein
MIGESDLEYFARLVEFSNHVSIKWSSLTSGHKISIASMFWRIRSVRNHFGPSTAILLFPSISPPQAGQFAS